MQFAWKNFLSQWLQIFDCFVLFLNILTYYYSLIFFPFYQHGLFAVVVGWLEQPPWRTSTAPTADRTPWGPGSAFCWARTTSSQWTNSQSLPSCWSRQPHHLLQLPTVLFLYFALNYIFIRNTSFFTIFYKDFVLITSIKKRKGVGNFDNLILKTSVKRFETM